MGWVPQTIGFVYFQAHSSVRFILLAPIWRNIVSRENIVTVTGEIISFFFKKNLCKTGAEVLPASSIMHDIILVVLKI